MTTTNRQLILFAGLLMNISNLLYGCTYSFESKEMCLVGIAITNVWVLCE
jgi:hypothetical protein